MATALLMLANAGLIARTVVDAPGVSARLIAKWLEASSRPPPPPMRRLIAETRRP